jgi:hypothetical protein
MATGWPMKVTYANGDVYSASDVNDTNGTINLLGQSVAVAAGKNKIINGAMQVWQRGTSITTSGAYTADRWLEVNAANNIVVSRSTDVPASLGFQYSMSRAGTGSNINQRIEAANAAQLAGQTVTLSFYYKSTAGADSLGYSLYYSNTADTFTAFTQIGATQTIATPSTSWTRVTYTYTNISANAANGLSLYIFRGSGATSTTLMTGIQLEVGSTATAFQTATGNAGSELAACQRYYIRTFPELTSSIYGMGLASSTTQTEIVVNLPTTMRINPSSFDSASIQVSDGVTGYSSGTFLLSTTRKSPNVGLIIYQHGSAALTQYRPYRLENASTTAGYLGFSAEL